MSYATVPEARAWSIGAAPEPRVWTASLSYTSTFQSRAFSFRSIYTPTTSRPQNDEQQAR